MTAVHKVAVAAARPTPVVSFQPDLPACFSSGRAQWRLRGTG